MWGVVLTLMCGSCQDQGRNVAAILPELLVSAVIAQYSFTLLGCRSSGTTVAGQHGTGVLRSSSPGRLPRGH